MKKLSLAASIAALCLATTPAFAAAMPIDDPGSGPTATSKYGNHDSSGRGIDVMIDDQGSLGRSSAGANTTNTAGFGDSGGNRNFSFDNYGATGQASPASLVDVD